MRKSVERVDEIDREGNVIATHPKSYFSERMFLHKVSLVLPMTGRNQVLLTRRAKNKRPFPDVWVCGVGGKARSGESEEETAIREMQEEIGKTYPLRKVVSFLYDESDYKAIFTVFTTTVPIRPEELKLDPSEVQYSKGYTVDEILQMIKDSPKQFAPTFIAALKEFARHQRSL